MEDNKNRKNDYGILRGQVILVIQKIKEVINFKIGGRFVIIFFNCVQMGEFS